MLDELIVENLGVIERAEFRPGRGLVVITGETGAGKTLLLGALRLLMGEAADAGAVGPFGPETVVSGRWIVDGEEMAVTRRVPSKGRSRGYLDGMVASVASLSEAVGGLVEIIGQQEHLRLRRPAQVRETLDATLDEEGSKALASYEEGWEERRRLEGVRAELGGGRAALERELDMVSFQADEIGAAGFSPGDDARLISDARRLRNREALRGHLGRAGESLSAARESLGETSGELNAALALDPGLEELMAAVDSAEQFMEEAAYQAEGAAESLDTDAGMLEELERRLSRLGDLRRKYGSTLEEVLAFGARAEQRREEIREMLGTADDLEADVAAAEREVLRWGEALTEARRRAARKLAETALGHLGGLGFGRPVLRFEVSAAPAAAHGCDRVRLLFSSDERLTPGEVGRVASGGELSRLVLALRLAGGTGTAPTMIFDEVDAGLGGAVALSLGRKLAAVSQGTQVLCVTHLASVAAFADHHWVIAREGAAASLRPVGGEERVAELSRMISGDPASESGRNAARELLATAASAR
ncbi:MAG: AAA family ATPase [bacterium]|nr:AAA family ATPase [bacterium]MDE0602090.1 AAA family ATPase [bacterium]